MEHRSRKTYQTNFAWAISPSRTIYVAREGSLSRGEGWLLPAHLPGNIMGYDLEFARPHPQISPGSRNIVVPLVTSQDKIMVICTGPVIQTRQTLAEVHLDRSVRITRPGNLALRPRIVVQSRESKNGVPNPQDFGVNQSCHRVAREK